MTARDIMTTNPFTLSPDCSVGQAIRKFRDTKFQAFPVVDADGVLVGTLNIWRVLRHVLPPYIVSGDLPDVRFAPDLERFHGRLAKMQDDPVSTIMNRTPPVAKPDDSVLGCATIMLNALKTVHLLPVVDESRHLLGIIAPWDLIKEGM